MSTEPNESRVRDLYANATAWDFYARDERPDLVRLRSNAYAEFDRFVAKIKADALRQAAYVAGDECDEKGGYDWLPSEWADQVSGWLEYRADRIEEEA